LSLGRDDGEAERAHLCPVASLRGGRWRGGVALGRVDGEAGRAHSCPVASLRGCRWRGGVARWVARGLLGGVGCGLVGRGMVEALEGGWSGRAEWGAQMSALRKRARMARRRCGFVVDRAGLGFGGKRAKAAQTAEASAVRRENKIFLKS